MAYFKNDRFKKPSFNRGSDRGGFRAEGGPKRLYKANCTNCGTECEVPFQPDGIKPVFCRNCFSQGAGREPGPRRPGHAGDSRGPRREFSPRPNFSERRDAPQPDRRIESLQRSLAAVEEKLDRLTALIRDTQAAPANAAPKAAKAPARKAVKKVKKK